MQELVVAFPRTSLVFRLECAEGRQIKGQALAMQENAGPESCWI